MTMAVAETLKALLHSFPLSGLAGGRSAVQLWPPGVAPLPRSPSTEQRESAESWEKQAPWWTIFFKALS